MVAYKEKRLVPDMNTVHVKEGCENTCEDCENWGEACETCDISVPLVGSLVEKEVTFHQMTICGIPAGEPYPVK